MGLLTAARIATSCREYFYVDRTDGNSRKEKHVCILE